MFRLLFSDQSMGLIDCALSVQLVFDNNYYSSIAQKNITKQEFQFNIQVKSLNGDFTLWAKKWDDL